MKKVCKRCKAEKELEEFYTHKQMKDEHLNICIECKLKDKNKYYHKKQKEILEDAKKYREKNKEQVKESKKKCYEQNKEYYLEKGKKYYLENIEEKRKHSYDYYHSHKEQQKERTRKRRLNGDFYFTDLNHGNKRRAQQKETDITKEWLLELRRTSIYCPLCGKLMIKTKTYHPDQKQLDHIIQLWEGGKHMKNNVRYTCANCNNHRPKPRKY